MNKIKPEILHIFPGRFNRNQASRWHRW